MRKNKDFTKTNEWELSIEQENALKKEDFETCFAIQNEIDSRIKNRTINHSLMNGFKYWNPRTQKFEGSPKYNDNNRLFNKYKPS